MRLLAICKRINAAALDATQFMLGPYNLLCSEPKGMSIKIQLSAMWQDIVDMWPHSRQ